MVILLFYDDIWLTLSTHIDLFTDADEEEEAAVNKRRSRKSSDYDDDWMKSRTKSVRGMRGRGGGCGRGGRTPRKVDPNNEKIKTTTKRKSAEGDKEKTTTVTKKQRTPRKKTSPEGPRK